MAETGSASMYASSWYPDPCERHEYRYWDGSTWSDQVADHGIVSSDPPSPDPSPDALRDAAQAREPTRTVTLQTPGEVRMPLLCVACAAPIGASTHTTARAASYWTERGTMVLTLDFALCEACGATHDRVQRAWRRKKLSEADLTTAQRVDDAVAIARADDLGGAFMSVEIAFANRAYAEAFERANDRPVVEKIMDSWR